MSRTGVTTEMAKKHQHDWAPEALLKKAQRYAEIMIEQERENWQFGFWSSLVLEHIVRAAVAGVSPVLLADAKDWNNLYYALGHKPTPARFEPKSAATADLLERLGAMVPEFTRELLGFCREHINRRNEEVHSGACPFDSLGSAKWQPQFYAACGVLLKSVGSSLGDIFGETEAESAEAMLDALSDDAAKSVAKTIKGYASVWEDKPEAERTKLVAAATAQARKTEGHRVACPACSSPALVVGSAHAPPTKKVEGDLIIVRQPMLPAAFFCTACGLKIAGFSKLHACGLGDIFTATSKFDAAEYFAEDDDYGPEPDYNEVEPD